MIYQLCNDIYTGQVVSAKLQTETQTILFPFNPANTDYQNSKTQINDESAQLEDVNGLLLSPEEAKAYVATLP